MRRHALLKRHELFIGAGILAAHANFFSTGFRQRDVRFLTELFANWTECSLPERELLVQNTQVQRYLEELAAEGYARRQTKGGKPRYRLTRVGLMEMLSRLSSIGSDLTSELFFFLFYFIHNYQPKITELIEQEGRQFPLALKIEVEMLLDSAKLLRAQIYLVENELRKLDSRINEAYRAAKLAGTLFEKGHTLDQVASKVERQHPYELNSQKPLHELIDEVPVELRRWELEIGSLRRAQHIWEPTKAVLRERLAALRSLEEAAAAQADGTSEKGRAVGVPAPGKMRK